MAKGTRISDVTLIEYINKGLKNSEIERELGAAHNSLGHRLRKLRQDIDEQLAETVTVAVVMDESKPDPVEISGLKIRDPEGIDYGVAKAAELIKQSKVDVDGILAEIKANNDKKKTERLAVALEHCGVKDPDSVEQLFEKIPEELPTGNLADDPISSFFPARISAGRQSACNSFEEQARAKLEGQIRRYRDAKETILKCIEANEPIGTESVIPYNDLIVLMSIWENDTEETSDEYSESDSQNQTRSELRVFGV